MAAAAASTSVAAAFVDGECRPVEDEKVGFTGVMARYLASIEMAGCELEVPPEQFDPQPQRLRAATPSSHDCSDIGAQHLPLVVSGTSSPRRQQKVHNVDRRDVDSPRRRKLKSKRSADGTRHADVDSPESAVRNQQLLLAAQLNRLHTAGASASDDDSGCGIEEFTWVPAGLTNAQVHQYMRSIPSYAVPLVGTAGDRNRIRRLLRQLPPHDNEARYCHVTLGDDEQRELSLFCQRRKREALGRGEVRPLAAKDDNNPAKCAQCGGVILGGDLAVTASRSGPMVQWHPQCFVCCVCSDLLVDLIYFHDAGTGQMYCGRHHAETLKPRCAACDEIIFSDECTEAEGLSWHMEHFTCAECRLFLGGQRYVVRGAGTLDVAASRDRPPTVFCCDCYERCYADRCVTCERPIKVDEGHMAHGGLHWHATDACFSCCECRRSLIGCSFVPREGVVYCTVCANDSSSFDRGRHYDRPESTEALNDSSSDFTISRRAATITHHLFQPCSPDGSTTGYLGGDETTRKASCRSALLPSGRSATRIVSRGTASRYIDESSDCSEDDMVQKRQPRRNQENLPLRHEPSRRGFQHTQRRQRSTELRQPNYSVLQLRDDQRAEARTSRMSSHRSMTSQSNHYEEFDYSTDAASKTKSTGLRRSVVISRENVADGYGSDAFGSGLIINEAVNHLSGDSSDNFDSAVGGRCSSNEDHKYYDVIDLQNGLDESRDDGDETSQQLQSVGEERPAAPGSSQFVSESVRRYLEAAEAWDCHRGGPSMAGGRRGTCSTCSSSSSDSSEFDYYLDKPSTTGESVSWGSGNRLVQSAERHKSAATCTKQCVVS